ncbi:MAG: tRNA 5-methoxyuridine(34)/uridine 5-oxyacetic acid(34) synthase CmoB [Chitinophagaceae bacterium]|nr:tRNA 5-methoxyuridine(34)/uridine 5-oxyacetic acid(34) synthase CmoB [Oligoflexus sp.]
MGPGWATALGPRVDVPALLALRSQLNERLNDERWTRWREGSALTNGLQTGPIAIEDGWVTVAKPDAVSASDEARLDAALKAFLPWKKGPYSLWGRRIDTEWRSNLKWQRVLPFVGPLEGAVVADIGSHNGYFMYFIKALGAAHVIGFEPMPINVFNHRLLQNLSPTPEINVELFGVEHIDLFPESFDTIFCMGILYHHTDPVGLLRKMRIALKPKGRIIIDCQGIPGEDSMSLTPTGRYAGATGVWFLPTLLCLQNWIKRAGFSQQKAFYSEPLTSVEQRATPWADVKSLSDFLDPHDPGRTIEGHPAPYRHYLMIKI